MLTAPHRLNPDITPHLEKAVLAALAMHPDKRPADVAAFRALLTPGVVSAAVAAPGPWEKAIRDNAGLIVLALLLLSLAIFTTSRTPLADPALPAPTAIVTPTR